MTRGFYDIVRPSLPPSTYRTAALLFSGELLYTLFMHVSPHLDLERFHPIVAQWFVEEVGEPTPVQVRSWPLIASGEHCLISAPTGTGKTLAAFLTAIDALIQGREGRVLYISPLKALNNDIERNLARPLSALRRRFTEAGEVFPEIRVGVRSGDTEQSERRHLVVHPPEILVTTPESLNLMLSSKSGLRGLVGFTTVILDEIHAVLSSKRGTYLMSGVERLVALCGEFQRIALSATVRPMSLVAEVLGAFRLKHIGKEHERLPRPVRTVDVHSTKRYEIAVGYPVVGADTDIPAEVVTPGEESEEWWNAITSRLIRHIRANRSTLIFANSRRMVEKIARLINERGEEAVYAHHGSLSKEIRSVVEERLKAGELAAIVATSSLELGIDIGEIDEVVLVQAPFSIASAIQRIGRAGHGVGAVSRATIFPIHSRDLIESAALAEAIGEGAIEDVDPPEKPLDVLAQIILSAALFEPVPIEDMFIQLRCIHAYRNLDRRELELVVEMLSGRYADTRIKELNPRLIYDRTMGTIRARKNAAMLLYMSGGVIPDRGYFNLRIADSKVKIGELDEEFVWERSLGDAFPFSNRAWRITRITHNDVEVLPAERSSTLVPFWIADDISRPFVFSEHIARFLEKAEVALREKSDLAHELERVHRMERSAALSLCEYLKLQRSRTDAALPHRRHVLIERYHDPKGSVDSMQIVIHTIWGAAVNKPLALCLSAVWKERFGYPLETFTNNDAVLLNAVSDYDETKLFQLLEGRDLSRLLRESIEGGGLFGARFRENAQRALLLPRKRFSERMPLWVNRLRSKKLLHATSRHEDFPIILETWRECMQSEFDLEQLVELLAEIRHGEITLSFVHIDSPSPFASAILWRQIEILMYTDDAASVDLRTSLSDELLQEVLHSPHLRPDIPFELAEALRRKLQRVEADYAPDSAEELLAWVDERLYVPLAEWRELLDSIERGGGDTHAIVAALETRLYRYRRDGEVVGVLAVERRAFFEDAIAAVRDPGGAAGVLVTEEDGVDAGEGNHATALHRFLIQWLDYYGPVSTSWIEGTVPVAPAVLDSVIGDLTQSGALILDRITTDASEDQLCTTENLERLLRMRRAAARPSVEPLSPQRFQLFLAHYQGLAVHGDSLEEMEGRLEQLFGYPARAAHWESEILPARVDPYYPSWLDRAMGESELVWFGCGAKRVTFAFESDLDLFREPRRREVESDLSSDIEVEVKIEAVLARGGVFNFLDLVRTADCKSEEAASALWRLVWAGVARNDGIEALRRGVATNFAAETIPRTAERGRSGPSRAARGRGYNRWKATRPMSGNWTHMGEMSESGDPLEERERIKDRIRTLFARYGILFREMLKQELPALQW
ncbi:MAG: DEAD/DEAH box helicase, partial [Spirochaetales bacterium]|nr:DEAD/DEAH box helicase [Spirochaetales bacterium]